MEPVITDVREVLATTRSVRRRLDLGRPVSDEVLWDCIDLAEQAPTGGNQSSRRWLVIRDGATKASLADLYHEAGGAWMVDAAASLAGSGHPNEAVMRSAAHLATHLGEVPAIVIPTIWGIHDGSGKPGLFDSVIQAAWSFCLALRAHGLGSAWTTVHLGKQAEVAALLGIPEGVTQVVLLPVAHTEGLDFRRAPRRPAREIAFQDRWGRTQGVGGGGESSVLFADAPGVSLEIDIDASPERVWELVTDLDLPARFSTEFKGAVWSEGTSGPAVGATFVGTNEHPAVGQWQTTSYVAAYDAPVAFAWNVGVPNQPAGPVGNLEQPGAQWRFDIDALHGGRCRLRQSVILGPGESGITTAIRSMPGKEARIIARRLAEHEKNITATLAGVKAEAESAR